MYLDELKEMPSAAIDSIHGDPQNPTVAWTTGRMLRDVNQDVATVLLEFAGDGKPFPFIAAEMAGA